MSERIFLYQIFYDQSTKASLERGYRPLDNTGNERPDWYELWPIRKFLLSNKLDADAWYGFFSPRFNEKTGVEYHHVHQFVSHFQGQADVTFFPRRWDHIAFFRNVFIHGELAHPGIIEMTAEFLNRKSININLNELVNHSGNAVYSNNVVAKGNYWQAWLELVENFFSYVEYDNSANAQAIRMPTTYGARSVPMKTFIQERLNAIVIKTGSYKIATLDTSVSAAISDLFYDEPRSRRLLQVCDLLKQDYTKTSESKYLTLFEQMRTLIPKAPRLRALEATSQSKNLKT
jgi:hypothetical protein